MHHLLIAIGMLMAPATADNNAEASLAIENATIPVYNGDVNRPYRVIGEIKDNLRKHFAFQADPTEQKVHAELWERGRKMGADAVIHARYGPTKGTMINLGRTPISGIAIKFLDGSEASAQ